MEELNLYVDYIHTKGLYLIQLYKIDENGEVLKYLERYTTHNIHSAVNKVKEITDRYPKITIISEDVGFNTHYMNKVKISTLQQVKDINKKNNVNPNSKGKIKVYNDGDIVEKINILYRDIKNE